MKTPSEIKFEHVLNEGFHKILKPLGFRKKGSNFYLQRENFGQIINLQKSVFGSKKDISFTINAGLFIPEYFLGFFTYHNKEVPNFPTESECLIRKRIDQLGGKYGWYNIQEVTNEAELILEMQNNLENFILPYFNKYNTKQGALDFMENEEELGCHPLGKLIVYCELNDINKAKREYENLLRKYDNVEHAEKPSFILTIDKYSSKYGFE